MKIKSLLCTEGLGGFFFDDEEAMIRGAVEDGFTYQGNPVTPGYTAIRMPARSVSVMLILDDGQVAYGDCVWSQTSGRSGREPLLPVTEIIDLINLHISPRLHSRELRDFKPLAEEIDSLTVNGGRLNSGLRWGVTQALLDAVARAKKKTMAEVIAEEYHTKLAEAPVPLWAQCEDDWYRGADKMILKRIAVMPEPLFHTVERFEKILDYTRWLSNRIAKLGDPDYIPTLFFVLCGSMGQALGHDMAQMVGFCRQMQEAAKPYRVLLEDPVVMGSKKSQFDTMKKLREALKSEGIDLGLVADEWSTSLEDRKEFIAGGATDVGGAHHPNDLGGLNNAIDIVQFCKAYNVTPVVGATCCETERSAQIRAHIALATQPSFILCAPGMGMDEGASIVHNEMQRTLALIRKRKITS